MWQGTALTVELVGI